MFHRLNIRLDIDIGAWSRGWTLLWRWYSGMLKDVHRFHMPMVRHAEEVSYLPRLLSFVRIADVTSEYRGLKICYLENPLDEFCLVEDADAQWRELEFEGR